MPTNPIIHNLGSIGGVTCGVAELNGDIFAVRGSDGGLYKNYVYLKDIGPNPLFITSDGIRYLYITIYSSACIVKYDTTNNTFITSDSLMANPDGICYYNDNLYVNVGRVQIVNPSNLI